MSLHVQEQLGRWSLGAELQRAQRDRLEALLPAKANAGLQRSALRAWLAASKARAEQRAAAERKAALLCR